VSEGGSECARIYVLVCGQESVITTKNKGPTQADLAPRGCHTANYVGDNQEDLDRYYEELYMSP
jgi:hypothetical protein